MASLLFLCSPHRPKWPPPMGEFRPRTSLLGSPIRTKTPHWRVISGSISKKLGNSLGGRGDLLPIPVTVNTLESVMFEFVPGVRRGMNAQDSTIWIVRICLLAAYRCMKAVLVLGSGVCIRQEL